NCTHVKLHGKEIDDLVKRGQAVSAKFVIPYPPGFPIMVPGQVITAETITFMRKLDVKEIHGYQAALGLELIKPEKLGPGRKIIGPNGKKHGSTRRRATARRHASPPPLEKATDFIHDRLVFHDAADLPRDRDLP